MTNEQLAVKAAQGDRESLHKLYFAVAPFLYKRISRFFPMCKQARVEPEDLLQCGYFAFLEAVEGYSPQKGFGFLAYLDFPIRNVCNRELGRRGKKQVRTISLETPIAGGEFTIGDTIQDPGPGTHNYCELNDLQVIIRKEIDRLSRDQQCVIYGSFYEGKNHLELAQELGWTTTFVKSVKYAAYQALQRSQILRTLRKAYQFEDNLTPERMVVSFSESGLEIL